MKYWREVNGKHRIIKCSKAKIRELMANEAKKYKTSREYYTDSKARHWVEHDGDTSGYKIVIV